MSELTNKAHARNPRNAIAANHDSTESANDFHMFTHWLRAETGTLDHSILANLNRLLNRLHRQAFVRSPVFNCVYETTIQLLFSVMSGIPAFRIRWSYFFIMQTILHLYCKKQAKTVDFPNCINCLRTTGYLFRRLSSTGHTTIIRLVRA